MLKMMTFFQGLPGQQPAPGAPDFPRSPQKLPSTSEADSEASMSEASSEDPVPPPEAEAALGKGEEEGAKKKKKPQCLANVFSVFTKRKKKPGQPSPSEPEGKPESQPGPGGQLPSGRLVPHVGGVLCPLARGWAGRGLTRWTAGTPGGFHAHPLPNPGGGSRQTGLPSCLGPPSASLGSSSLGPWGPRPPLLWAPWEPSRPYRPLLPVAWPC